MIHIKNIKFILTIILITGCNLFETRNPEEPDTGRPSFQTPTSASVVILNFQNAILEKNVENYEACFADSVQTKNYHYIFTPTGEANGLYPLVFSMWDISSERRAFNSLVSNMKKDDYPKLDINFINPEPFQDSIVYIGDYSLTLTHSVATIPEKFAGKLQLTIVQGEDGLWYVYRWIDTKTENDTIPDTWSIMKALFYNL